MEPIFETLAEWFFEGFCYGIGRRVRRIFGLPPTEKGVTETVIGLVIIFSIVGAVVAWWLYG